LMVVVDGVQFAKPWVDGGRQKTGSLADDDCGGLSWRVIAPSEARYTEIKPRRDNNPHGVYVERQERRAVRVFPA
jgi:hypothetical protein